jgi:hypothetical protein
MGSAALALTGGRSGRHDGDKGGVFVFSRGKRDGKREFKVQAA